jgi:hypothetical protein
MKYTIQKWGRVEKKVNPLHYELGGNMMQGIVGAGNSIGSGLQSTGSSLGTIGGGALKGAAAGMALGPIGAAVGGAIGLVGGLLKNKQNNEQEEAQKVEQNKIMLANKQQALFNMGPSGGGLGGDTRFTSPAAYGGYLVNPITSFSKGGYSSAIVNKDKALFSYQGGGTHQQNPLGGIPLGKSLNGKQNTVEQGETSFKFKEGKYIFSNRLKLK